MGTTGVHVAGKIPSAVKKAKSSYWSRLLTDFRRDYGLYVILIPAIVWFFLFYYRKFYGVLIAFKDYSIFKGVGDSPWVGLDNFRTVFSGPYFWRSLKNTIMINLYQQIFQWPVPIMLAILLNEVRRKGYKRLIQTMTYMPHFISMVIIVGIVVAFLSPDKGLVNLIIEKLGGEKTYFIMKPNFFRPIYIGMHIWKEAGFSAIVYLAALSAIDEQLYEAAVMDGAGKFRQIWHVTLPGIAPTIIILLILGLGRFFNEGFQTIILMYQPATYQVADVVSSYGYRVAFVDGNYSVGAAIGIFNSVAMVLTTIFFNRLSKKTTGISLW